MRRIIWSAVIFLFLLLLFLFFFRPKLDVNRKQISREAELHTVKRITQKQITAEVTRLGDSLVSATDSLLLMRLRVALEKSNLTEALWYYPPQHYPEVQAFIKKYTATLTRTQKKSAVNNQAPVKPISQTQLLYTKPIYLQNNLCLKCHGTVGADVANADYELLKKQYPDFGLVGYHVGEQLGTWQMQLPRQVILQTLTLRGKKSRRPR